MQHSSSFPIQARRQKKVTARANPNDQARRKCCKVRPSSAGALIGWLKAVLSSIATPEQRKLDAFEYMHLPQVAAVQEVAAFRLW